MVLLDHGGALDYDLMTRTAYTLEDVGGRLRMRSLSHFLQYLPPDSATMRELNPEDAEKVAWSMGRVDSQILAAIVDEVRALRDDVANLKVYLDTGALVGGISRQMDGSLGRRQMMAGRGVV